MRNGKTKKTAAVVKVDRHGFVRCRVCGCTQFDPCPSGCGWAPGEADLCTVCAAAAEALREWFENSRRGNIAALKREVWPKTAKTGARRKRATKEGGK